MPLLANKLRLFCVFLVLSLSFSLVYGDDTHRIDPNEVEEMTEHEHVYAHNDFGLAYFVPTKTLAEYTSFIDKAQLDSLPGVTICKQLTFEQNTQRCCGNIGNLKGVPWVEAISPYTSHFFCCDVGSHLVQCDSNMMDYWTLDYGTGSTAFDAVGSNNCALTGSPLWLDAGKVGGAIRFSGSTSDYINCGADSSLNIGDNSFSLESWVRVISGALLEADISSNVDTLEFETDYCIEADIVRMSDTIFAVACKGPANDGWIKTMSVDSVGNIGNTVLGSYEFDGADIFEPDMIKIDGDTVAVAFRNSANLGRLETLNINGAGAISPVSALNFDNSRGEDPSIEHVAGDVYAIAYCGRDSDGWTKTIAITSTGAIRSAEFEFDTLTTYEPDVINISDTVFAIAYRGDADDGWVETFSVENGFIRRNLDTLEFDVTYAAEPDIIHISNNIFAVAYRGPSNYGYVKTFTIDTNGQIGASTIASLTFDIITGYEPTISHASGDTYVIAYRGRDNDGWVKSIAIDSSGQIKDAFLEFEPLDAYESDIINISDTVFAIAYRGPATDGFINTYQISNGQVRSSPLDTLEFDTVDCYEPDIVHVTGNYYAVVYRGESTDGFVKTFTITSAGTISNSVIDTYEFDMYEGHDPVITHLVGDVFSIAYYGEAADGWIKNIRIDSSGQISESMMEFDTADGYEPDLIKITDTVSAIVYRGVSADGFVKTVEIIDGFAKRIIDTLEFDIDSAHEPDIFHVTNNIYGIAYRKAAADYDGWLSTITIDSNGLISNSILDNYEFDLYDGYDPTVAQIDADSFAVAYRGRDIDGWVQTINIDSSGIIRGPHYEFDTTGYVPRTVKVSDTVVAVAYRGPGDDGWVKTLEVVDGHIRANQLDSLEFETSYCVWTDIIHVSGNNYAAVCRGPGYDGWAYSFSIASNGQISNSVLGSLEFEIVDIAEPSLVHVSGDIVAVAYRNVGGNNDGFVKTFSVNSAGAISTVIDTLEFAPDYCEGPSISKANTGDDFVVTCRGPANDGWAYSFSIDSAGMISDTVLGSREFETVDIINPDTIHVSGDVVAVAYRNVGGANDGFVKTFSVNSVGVISAVSGNLEFDTLDGYEPDIVQVSGDRYAIAYRGEAGDGFVKTFTINSGGAISAVSDTLEFDLYDGLEPSIVNVKDDVFVVNYRSTDADLWARPLRITAAGQIDQPIMEFDIADCYEPSIVKVSNNVYAITYRGVTTDGFVKTVEIDNGFITRVIDTLEYDTVDSYEPRILHIIGDIYAVAYRGVTTDGFVKTFTINSAGTISNSVISTLEFDTLDGYEPSIVQVSGDRYAVAYRGEAGDGWLKTFTINAAGTISGVSSSFEFDDFDGYESRIIHVKDNVFAIAHRGRDLDGWLKTVTIEPAGTIRAPFYEYDAFDSNEQSIVSVSNTIFAVAYRGTDYDGWIKTFQVVNGHVSVYALDSFEFDVVDGYEPEITHVTGNVYAVVYRGVSVDGFVKTFTMDPVNGQISNSAIDVLEFDTVDCYNPEITHVTGNVYAVVYTGEASDGWLRTFTIDAAGSISNSVLSSYEFDMYDGYEPRIIHVKDDIFAITYRGEGADGFIRTVRIDGSGGIKTTSYEFNTVDAWEPSIIRVSDTISAIVYRDASTDGFVKTIEVTDGYIRSSILDTLEYDTLDSYEPRVAHISGDVYVVVYRGEVTDGFAKTFTVASNGQISNAVIDTLEFDAVDGYEPSITHVTADKYAVVHRGEAADGFLKTFTIDAAGNIGNSLLANWEFDMYDGYEPRIIKVADSLFAIIYRGEAADGWMKLAYITSGGGIRPYEREFDVANIQDTKIKKVQGNYYVISYADAADDGWLKTLQIDTTGAIIRNTYDSLEYDSTYARHSDVINITDSIYAVSHRGSGDDGFLRTFSVDSAGLISDSVIDTLEFDTVYGIESSLAHIKENVYAIAYRGPDSDGWLKTVTIGTGGAISDSVIDSFEFDTGTGIEVEMLPVNEKVMLIVYRGVNDDGFAKTISMAPNNRGIRKGTAYGIMADSVNAYAFINDQRIKAPMSSGWHHLVLTYDGITQKLYIDTVLSASQSFSGNVLSNANNLLIGRNMNADFDEVVLYNYAMLDAEIVRNFNFANNGKNYCRTT